MLKKINKKFVAEGGLLVYSVLKREIDSFPRSIFFSPPEKPEPLNYSYLPTRSICRALVNDLLQQSKTNSSSPPSYMKEVIHILSLDISRSLPPLNWQFILYFMNFDSEYLFNSLALFLGQEASRSAKTLLNNYLNKIYWNNDKVRKHCNVTLI